MFKTALPFKSLAIAATAATTVLAPLASFHTAQAASIFDEVSTDASRMIAIASPFGTDELRFNLIVLEQFEGKRACWSVPEGSSTETLTIVDPLLRNFDFSQDCRRNTDSNGYSMRIGGEDFGTQSLLRMVPTENNVLLVATPNDRSKPEIVIGQTHGIANDFLRIELKPGWEFTRRTYEGKALGHYYFSAANTSQIEYFGDKKPDVVEVAASRFTDIGTDIYRDEINQAVDAGFIAGFNDNTFRPTESLTREQLVSMAIESLASIPNSNVNVAQGGTSFPDVEAGRWSAGKIAWAQQNNIVSGYNDGTFRPTQQVTRAELMAILRRTAEYANSIQGKGTELAVKNNAFSFVDLDGHWASDLTIQMSTYCGVATPYQESGSNFLPNTPAQRNYAAAATYRMLSCSVN